MKIDREEVVKLYIFARNMDFNAEMDGYYTAKNEEYGEGLYPIKRDDYNKKRNAFYKELMKILYRLYPGEEDFNTDIPEWYEEYQPLIKEIEEGALR